MCVCGYACVWMCVCVCMDVCVCVSVSGKSRLDKALYCHHMFYISSDAITGTYYQHVN